ncbi:hypothetical protein, partial [Actinocorallia lasiicapitis]
MASQLRVWTTAAPEEDRQDFRLVFRIRIEPAGTLRGAGFFGPLPGGLGEEGRAVFGAGSAGEGSAEVGAVVGDAGGA